LHGGEHKNFFHVSRAPARRLWYPYTMDNNKYDLCTQLSSALYEAYHTAQKLHELDVRAKGTVEEADPDLRRMTATLLRLIGHADCLADAEGLALAAVRDR
jgi:hypothetical protein